MFQGSPSSGSRTVHLSKQETSKGSSRLAQMNKELLTKLKHKK